MRSLKKPPYIDNGLNKAIERAKKTENRRPIRVYKRASTIAPYMVGLNFEVHNGKAFQALYVTDNMVGHKFGEFALTRTFKGHAGDRKTKK